MAKATHAAVVMRKLGGPEVLAVEEVQTRAPGAGQARIRVEAAGIAWAQVLMRQGVYGHAPPLPFTPGAEICGVIEEVGGGVRDLAPGDRVVAFTGTGGYAQQIVVDAKHLVRVPAALDAGELASLPMNYVTAWQLLCRTASLRSGQSALIHGGGGGVGTALLQLCKVLGVSTISTEGRGKLALVRSLGAQALDREADDFVSRTLALTGGAGVDAAFDPIGGAHAERSRRALKPSGRLVIYGFAAPDADHGAVEYSLGRTFRDRPELIQEDLARLVGLLAEGRIAPVVAERLPLAEVARAHARLERGGVPGKLVLVP